MHYSNNIRSKISHGKKEVKLKYVRKNLKENLCLVKWEKVRIGKMRDVVVETFLGALIGFHRKKK